MTTTRERGDETRERIKAYITKHREQYGVSPSLQEIADGVGLRSHNAVRMHLLSLQAKGEVTWEPGRFRTVRVVA